MPDFIPRKDCDLVAWLQRFVAELENEPAAFGLDDAELKRAREASDSFCQSVRHALAAHRRAQGAVATKNHERNAVEETVRMLARKIQANPNVPDGAKQRLGLRVRTRKHESTRPQTPTALVAEPLASGSVVLKWKGNGNKPGTVYLIETRSGPAACGSMWQFVDVETRIRYSHHGVVMGQPAAYRVTAKRLGVVSSPSNLAAIYESYAKKLDAAA